MTLKKAQSKSKAQSKAFMKREKFDAVIIGAGHNGLVTANYLAKAGLKVCVLEQRHIVGGAAVSEEFLPGYRNSIASYVVSLLRSEVVNDLQLAKYGYKTIPIENSFYPGLNDDHLLISSDEEENKRQFSKFSSTDYAALKEFESIVEKVGDVVKDQWLREPPRLAGAGIHDLMGYTKMGLRLLKTDADTRYRMLQLFLGAPISTIDRWFSSDKIQAVVASHCLPANFASLHQPGASMPMLHHAVGELDGRKGAWGVVQGGMGTITQAMARSAEAKGVEIRVNSGVEKIIVERGVAQGVLLKSGEEVRARVVVANTDPKRTFLTLLGEEHLPASFARDIKVIRQESASLRMNLALSGLPEFVGMPSKGISAHHKSAIYIIESKDHVEQAYRSARNGIPANPPIVEALIPSTVDDSLTAPGHHVMSLLCKYMPYDLSGGKTWDEIKVETAEAIINYVSKYIPNLRDILVGYQCLTPVDLERMFGMTRGDICHGRLEPDQLFNARPHPDAAQYATPVPGLYICGSGSHPGGGVTGAPGYNAARRIIKDL
ncbi:NAD(P)/FAD-dependent oxidoreductase [Pseudomonas aeruginosa]|uniref:phytoene desaturase family protein n=1 Tax=Pseudomonas aeruginosa TaxID=287 RepID=UPI00300DC00F